MSMICDYCGEVIPEHKPSLQVDSLDFCGRCKDTVNMTIGELNRDRAAAFKAADTTFESEKKRLLNQQHLASSVPKEAKP